MASYELIAFDRSCPPISIVTAIDQQSPYRLSLGFWVTDPQRLIVWPQVISTTVKQDDLWEKTCFEVFIGVKDQDFYREINLSPSQAWQLYQFEEYRYPEQQPPVSADDIELIHIKKTHYGLNASLDLTEFMLKHELKWSDLYIATTAVIETAQQTQYFAMQHSGFEADFHNKRDWLHHF